MYTKLTALGFPSERSACELMLDIIEEALSSVEGNVFYILDDLQFITSSKLQKLISFLCDHMPERLHLVLLSRYGIFSAQEDFKLGSRLVTLDMEDLRLTEQGSN